MVLDSLAAGGGCGLVSCVGWADGRTFSDGLMADALFPAKILAHIKRHNELGIFFNMMGNRIGH
jgi:hypothetical protein